MKKVRSWKRYSIYFSYSMFSSVPYLIFRTKRRIMVLLFQDNFFNLHIFPWHMDGLQLGIFNLCMNLLFTILIRRNKTRKGTKWQVWFEKYSVLAFPSIWFIGKRRAGIKWWEQWKSQLGCFSWYEMASIQQTQNVCGFLWWRKSWEVTMQWWQLSQLLEKKKRARL